LVALAGRGEETEPLLREAIALYQRKGATACVEALERF
jgi:hypothetical protein